MCFHGVLRVSWNQKELVSSQEEKDNTRTVPPLRKSGRSLRSSSATVCTLVLVTKFPQQCLLSRAPSLWHLVWQPARTNANSYILARGSGDTNTKSKRIGLCPWAIFRPQENKIRMPIIALNQAFIWLCMCYGTLGRHFFKTVTAEKKSRAESVSSRKAFWDRSWR